MRNLVSAGCATLTLKRIYLKNDITSAFANIRKFFDYPCLLESASGSDKLSELSILVFDPSYILSSLPQKGEVELEDRLHSTGVVSLRLNDPLISLEKLLELLPVKQVSAQASFRFIGGAVGYVSYEYAKHSLSPCFSPSSSPTFPDIQFGIYEQGIIIDHRQRKSFYFFSDRLKDQSKEVEEICNSSNAALCIEDDSQNKKYNQDRIFRFSKPEVNISKEEFEESITKAKSYIRKGDVFQVVLSKKYKFKITGDILRFYSKLKSINPSPYMYLVDFDDTKIVGSSPEMLVRVDGRFIETFPIAGTRPSSRNEFENSRLAKELISDEKERAEHVMLVDLARNDVGRLAEFGSVSVNEFMKVHTYSHVQHIVSHVRGRLRDGMTSFDAVRFLFPAGTVSGAPKIRAMEIISELEAEPRGPYAGTVGYFSFNGNADFAITIRTLIARDNEAYIQAGVGIVADSEPAAEWFETEHKVAALMKALELASSREDRSDN